MYDSDTNETANVNDISKIMKLQITLLVLPILLKIESLSKPWTV